MAVFSRSERSFFHRFNVAWRRHPSADNAELRRLERKHRDAVVAMDNWTTLLRDMEHEGQTSDLRYERYFQAYLDAQRQLKRVELELFNVRHIQSR